MSAVALELLPHRLRAPAENVPVDEEPVSEIRLRLHHTESDQKTDKEFIDGVRMTVKDQLVDIPEAIEGATKRQLHCAEQQRIREQ